MPGGGRLSASRSAPAPTPPPGSPLPGQPPPHPRAGRARLHYVGREDPGGGRRNRAAERLVPGAELPHARVRAAAARIRGHQPRRAPDVARTPDQNQSTKNIRNPRRRLTHHFLRWLSAAQSPDAPAHARRSDDGRRHGHRSCGASRQRLWTSAHRHAESDGLAWPLEPLGSPGAAQVHGRWMPGTCGVHGRSMRVDSSVGGLLSRWLGGDVVGGRLLAVGGYRVLADVPGAVLGFSSSGRASAVSSALVPRSYPRS